MSLGPDLSNVFGDEPAVCPHPALRCPHCREHVCTATSTATGQDVAPAVRVATVCVFCTLPSVFAQSPLGVLTLRPPTEREAAEFATDPSYRRAVEHLERAKRAVRFGQSGSGLWTPGASR